MVGNLAGRPSGSLAFPSCECYVMARPAGSARARSVGLGETGRRAGDQREASTRLQAIFTRARNAAAGQIIEWAGKTVDPRYAFRAETILEWLEITPGEQREMRALIGGEEKRRRNRDGLGGKSLPASGTGGGFCGPSDNGDLPTHFFS